MAATSASLLVVTVATDRRGRDANGQASRPPLSASDALTREQDLCGLAALRASCSAAGARLAVLGLDSPFVGFGDKVSALDLFRVVFVCSCTFDIATKHRANGAYEDR